MTDKDITLETKIDRKKLLSLLESGKFSEAERYVDSLFVHSKQRLFKSILKYFVPRRETRDLANNIGEYNKYLRCELTMKTITIKVLWYEVKREKIVKNWSFATTIHRPLFQDTITTIMYHTLE